MKKKEIVILAIFVGLLAVALLAMYLIGGQSERRMIITVDGETYKNIILTEQTNMHFTVETPDGVNEVVIIDGVVDVVSADCKNQVCVNTLPASRVFDKIVCLPHRMIIQIAGDGDGTEQE
jgi:hypothetical protein